MIEWPFVIAADECSCDTSVAPKAAHCVNVVCSLADSQLTSQERLIVQVELSELLAITGMHGTDKYIQEGPLGTQKEHVGDM